MKKVILFGAGFYGEAAFFKLRNQAEILYYVDNDLSKVGERLYGIEIISPMKLQEIYDEKSMELIISSRYYFEISSQLNQMGILDYFVLMDGMLYHTNAENAMIPCEWNPVIYYQKNENEKNILFVQDTACIRTHKIASLMKENGYKVFLLYTVAPPESNFFSFPLVYDNVFTFYTYNAIMDFVENSEFDIIHSSNAPDILTCLLLDTSKHIVFDTHDMNSLVGEELYEQLVLEFIANTKSDGNMYTSNGVVEIAKQKYGLEGKEILSFENFVLNQEEINEPFQKLSSLDQEIHCVYEGCITGKDPEHFRYFESIWNKIAEKSIHIHFYSHSDTSYCKKLEQKSPYFHYEGNMGTKELIREMTKYDCGLAIFNVNDRNRTFLETGTANKMYEYLNSQLPVLVGDIKSYSEFVNKYNVGIQLDLDGDIEEQIRKACEIKINKNFLRENGLTMKSHCDELVNFYERVKKRKINR